MARQHVTKTNQKDHQKKKHPSARSGSPGRTPAQSILQLQQIVGNQAVGRMLQANMKIGQPGDKYEKEADRIADQVMRMPNREASGTLRNSPKIQRMCATCASGQELCPECAEEEDGIQRKPLASTITPLLQRQSSDELEEDSQEEILQPKDADEQAPEISPEVNARINALRGGGQSLPESTRAFFEPRFGHDFSQVRTHTNARAAQTAQELNARAYTVACDVVFGVGQYAPGTSTGRKLLAHELTHVVQQRGRHDLRRNSSRIRASNRILARKVDQNTCSISSDQQVGAITKLDPLTLQRDLARPPAGAPAPLKPLTLAEIMDAITFNENRFKDPYSIRVIRDVLGLAPVPVVVDEALIRAVVEWQAARRMTQDGKIGHRTTRSIYFELVAERQYRDAMFLLMDSYNLPGSLHLRDVRVATGPLCCGPTGGADAVTFGGPHCPPIGGPVYICFCRTHIPRTIADYDHFVRIVGHELIHVPQCAAGTGNVDVDEFEGFYWETCARGRVPQLSAAERVAHAHTALGHFASIPAHLRTPARIAMRLQLIHLIAAGGVGPC